METIDFLMIAVLSFTSLVFVVYLKHTKMVNQEFKEKFEGYEDSLTTTKGLVAKTDADVKLFMGSTANMLVDLNKRLDMLERTPPKMEVHFKDMLLVKTAEELPTYKPPSGPEKLINRSKVKPKENN